MKNTNKNQTHVYLVFGTTGAYAPRVWPICVYELREWASLHCRQAMTIAESFGMLPEQLICSTEVFPEAAHEAMVLAGLDVKGSMYSYEGVEFNFEAIPYVKKEDVNEYNDGSNGDV